MHVSYPITSASLPYNQSEFISPNIRYEHTPRDRMNFVDTDSFIIAYTDGTSWTEATVIIHIITMNSLPEVNATSATNITLDEDTSATYKLPFVDFDSPMMTIISNKVSGDGARSEATNASI